MPAGHEAQFRRIAREEPCQQCGCHAAHQRQVIAGHNFEGAIRLWDLLDIPPWARLLLLTWLRYAAQEAGRRQVPFCATSTDLSELHLRACSTCQAWLLQQSLLCGCLVEPASHLKIGVCS